MEFSHSLARYLSLTILWDAQMSGDLSDFLVPAFKAVSDARESEWSRLEPHEKAKANFLRNLAAFAVHMTGNAK